MPHPSPRRRSVVAALFTVAALTRCAPGGTESGRPRGGPEASGTAGTSRPPSGRDTPAPSASAHRSTHATAPGMPTEPLLDWLVTGGFAGVHVRTLLYGDSRYTVTPDGAPGRDGRLPDRDVARIRALLVEARLDAAPRRTLDPRLRDGFRYRIAHAGHVVHRDDTTLDEPLREVRALLPSPGSS